MEGDESSGPKEVRTNSFKEETDEEISSNDNIEDFKDVCAFGTGKFFYFHLNCFHMFSFLNSCS